MTIMRICCFSSVLFFFALTAYAQIPGMIRWWDGAIVRDLGLSSRQREEIRQVVRESRENLIQLRAAVQIAEAELQDEMNEEKVDADKARAAIEKVVAARSELMRDVSRMSLSLRMILTAEQWRELQRRERQLPNEPDISGPGTGAPQPPPLRGPAASRPRPR